jgi:biotin transport system substrate-specific component
MRVLTQLYSNPLTGRKALVAALFGAVFTSLCAQAAFYLPGNPVPVTLQVFGVICCGLVLGSRIGALSQFLYIVAGVMGAPVFAGFRFGIGCLVGPTGGYLVGFVAAAYVVGLIFESSERMVVSAFLAGLVGVSVTYAFGLSWLSIWLRLAGDVYPRGWLLGIAPFVGLDILKAGLAASLVAGRRYL